MKRLPLVVVVAILLSPVTLPAQPPGCSWQGDPALRYGWNYLDGMKYHQPGPDTATIIAGRSVIKELGPFNASATWQPTNCKAFDTLCFDCWTEHGWDVTGTVPGHNTPLGALYALGSGYLWYQYVQITAPCSAVIGTYEMVVGGCLYANGNGVCDRNCGDCVDPDLRPADGKYYYSKDTLYLKVVAPPPAVSILVDTFPVLVERGQSQAYIPFSLCSTNPCAPPTAINYIITSKGHIPPAGTYPWTGSVTVPGGECKDAYAILNAATIPAGTWDTLTCIAWMGTAYDTSVQVIHVMYSLCGYCVPVLTPAVAAFLAIALVLAAALFIRKGAARKATS